ncbi:MAG: CaiB/BaiF CoA transferase family protein [Acidimicrobiales bacterium]
MSQTPEAPQAAEGPLAGLTVADFSRVLAAPYATMLLADLGADVIKVENPDGGDDSRRWGPPFVGEEAAYFLAVNRNKRSITLDLRSEAGRQAAAGLVRRSDVVVENFRPGTTARFCIDYERARVDNPGVVYCSITGFGAGRGAGLPGYDLLVQAVGGLMSVTGPRDGEATKVGVAVVDVLTGLHAAVGVLAALRHRDRTGEGQHVEIDLLSCLLSSLVNQAAAHTLAGVVPGRLGNRHPSVVPYEVFATADRPLVIAVGNDRQFRALCDGVGAPGLATDVRFITNADRVAHVGELADELGQRLRERSAEEWFDMLTPLGIPCGPVNDLPEAFAFAEQLGLGPTVGLARSDGEEPLELTANPIGLSATPASYRMAPPRLGEHTAEVLAWLAG